MELKVIHFTTTKCCRIHYWLFFSFQISMLSGNSLMVNKSCPQTLHFCVLILALLLISSSVLKSLSLQPRKLFPAVCVCVCVYLLACRFDTILSERCESEAHCFSNEQSTNERNSFHHGIISNSFSLSSCLFVFRNSCLSVLRLSGPCRDGSWLFKSSWLINVFCINSDIQSLFTGDVLHIYTVLGVSVI